MRLLDGFCGSRLPDSGTDRTQGRTGGWLADSGIARGHESLNDPDQNPLSAGTLAARRPVARRSVDMLDRQQRRVLGTHVKHKISNNAETPLIPRIPAVNIGIAEISA
jgi:hypothetical protein